MLCDQRIGKLRSWRVTSACMAVYAITKLPMLRHLRKNWTQSALPYIILYVLQAHCDSLAVATVERYQLLQAAVAMLPGGVQSAHAEELLQRHHHEQLEPQVLRQVRSIHVQVLPEEASLLHCLLLLLLLYRS
jgi:hypothetical protein